MIIVGKGSDPSIKNMVPATSKESVTTFLIAGRLYDWTEADWFGCILRRCLTEEKDMYTLLHPPSILKDFPLSQFVCNIRQVNLTFKSVSTPFWQKYSSVVVVANKHPSMYGSIGISKLEFQNKTNGKGVGWELYDNCAYCIRCGLACPLYITNIRYIWDFNEPSEKCTANINTATLDTTTTRGDIQSSFSSTHKWIHNKRVFFGLGEVLLDILWYY